MGLIDKARKMFRRDPVLKRRVIGIFIAHIIMGLGVNLLRVSLFGNDPFSCMMLGFSGTFGMSYGTLVVMFNLIAIIPIFILDRSYIQFGTLVNMFMFGPIVDAWFAVLIYFFPALANLALFGRVMCLIAGVVICCFGASMYMTTNLGMGPYDAIGWIIEKKTNKKVPFKYARIGIDSASTITGFIFGSIVSLGTFTMALGTGPLVVFFTENINKKLIYG